MFPNNPVLIIGGGAAGLSTAVALAKRNIAATILEREEKIGASWSSRYHNLKLHTVRKYSGLSYYSIPEYFPQYLSKDEYADYLNEYAEVHRLDISLGEEVLVISKEADEHQPKVWTVETNRCKRKAQTIVIATGKYANPYIPEFLGLTDYRGLLIHSSQYSSNTAFKGLNVLVVGLGNSGAEIAAELSSDDTTKVAVSVRTVPPIVTREIFKIIPVQLAGIVFSKLKIPSFFDYIGAKLRRLSVGDLSEYGVGEAKWGPFVSQRPAVIDAGFIKQLKKGLIQVRPEVSHFESGNVFFSDGSWETFDVVIAATGFQTGLENILKVPNTLDAEGLPLTQVSGDTSDEGLYFVGFNDTVRGQLLEIKQESKKVAREIAQHLTKNR